MAMKIDLKKTFNVFISYKSSDFSDAKEVYDLLSLSCCKPFLSHNSLKEVSAPIFQNEIDAALEQAEDLIVVCSSRDSVASGWVEAEWRLFDSLQKSGKKKGSIISLLCDGMTSEELPHALQGYQTLSVNEPNWRTMPINLLSRSRSVDDSLIDDTLPHMPVSVRTIKLKFIMKGKATAKIIDDTELVG
jgi:hypothetical protein